MQTVIVLTVIICAVAYSVLRVYKAIKNANDPCHGCEGCKIKEQMKRKRAAGCTKDRKIRK